MIHKFTVPDDIYNNLNNCIKDKTDPYNQHLVGNIAEEYSIYEYKNLIEEFLLYEIGQSKFMENFKLAIFHPNPQKLKLNSLWLNFQKKHEFNPPHKHSGIYSFVIYLQIPFDLKKEEEIYPSLNDEGNNHTSKFAFVNVNTLGKIFCQCIPVDKSFEGKIILFPAEQIHQVFPFYTSNKYRISVSGNIRLKV